LVEQSKVGNQIAMYQLYQNYSKAMFNICCRIVNNIEEAEDTLQEAFTDAFRKLDSFRFESTFGAWLKKIVVNKSINVIKKRSLELKFTEEIERYDMIEDEQISEEDIKYEVNKIKKAMEKLPEGFRLVFSLFAIEGYDHKEISEILNISESTSKTQYLRAKRKIVELCKMQNDE